MSKLGFKSNQIDGIIQTLGAIFHLSYASATQGSASKSTFIRSTNAEIAAKLLGITFDQLSQAVFLASTTNIPNFSLPGKINIK